MEGRFGFVGPLKTLEYEPPSMTFMFGVGIPAAARLRADVDDRFEKAWDTLHDADVGDFVIFNTERRKAALEVTDIIPGDPKTIEVTGAGGGVFEIEGKTNQAGTPAFSTDKNEPANDIRPATDEEIHDYLEQVGGRQPDELKGNGGDEEDDVPDAGFGEGFWREPSDVDETPGVQAGKTPFEDVSIQEHEEILEFRAYHTDFDADVSLVFARTTEGWEHADHRSDYGGANSHDEQATIVQDAEDILEERGYTVLGLMDTGSGDDSRDVGQNWPSKPAEDAREYTGDSYVQELSGSPGTDFEDFQNQAGLADSSEDHTTFRPSLSNADPSWTFVDELLARDLDVPKTVNNWHLIDYGLVGDEDVDTQRKIGWYNTESSELLAVVGVRRDDETRWFVFHAESSEALDAEPDSDHDSAREALDAALETLYEDHNDDTSELSVHEEPMTGEVRVWDAVTNTQAVRALSRVADPDPYGLRTYVRDTSGTEFIQDIDAELVAFYNWLQGLRGGAAERWEAFVEGAGLPTRSRTRAFISGIDFGDVGRDVRAALLMAAAGLRRRFMGLNVSPVIKYDELGVDVQYLYSSKHFGSEPVRLTVDPRRKETVTDERGNERLEYQGYYLDSLLPSALSYYHVVEVADWAKLNQWVFTIPDPWSEETPTVNVGRPSDSNTASSIRDLASKSSASGSGGGDIEREGAPTLTRTSTLDEEYLGDLLDTYSGSKGKQKYLARLAVLNRADEQGMDIEEYDGPDQRFKSDLGQIVADFAETMREHGLQRDDVKDWDVYGDSLANIQLGGMKTHEALDDALEERKGDDVTTSEDFADRVFTDGDGGDVDDDPQPTQQDTVEDPAPSDGGQDDGVDDDDGGFIFVEDEPAPSPPSDGSGGGTELSPNEQERVDRLVDKLDDGIVGIDDLNEQERALLSKAQEAKGILPEGQAQKLAEIRGATQASMDDRPVGDGGDHVGEMLDLARERGAINDVAAMGVEDRSISAREMHDEMTNPGEREHGDPAMDDRL